MVFALAGNPASNGVLDPEGGNIDIATRDTQLHQWLASLSHVLSHALITVLAVALAFSLPVLAEFIQRMWPQLEADAHLMLVTEIFLASALVLLFNLAKIMWDNRSKVASARLAALVHARGDAGLFSRWKERELVRTMPASRDALILTITGFDTLVERGGPLRAVLQSAYEFRVMLLNPLGIHMQDHATSFPDHHVSTQSLTSEIEATIAALSALRKLGKNVTLKFYDTQPLWKLVILGDHAWVQHCHSGFSVKDQPEYVFAFQHHEPRRGFYVPFYSHFLGLWNQSNLAEFDFDRHELVFRGPGGVEDKRVPFRSAGGVEAT